MNENRFSRCAALMKSADLRSDSDLSSIASIIADKDGVETIREVFRFMHLFRGFPLMVRSLGQIKSLLSESKATTKEDSSSDIMIGREFFNELYQEDADQVVPVLNQLDSTLSHWVIDHAYGRVMNRDFFPVTERERMAVLLLAADQCWDQWFSHVRISLRLGVSPAQLLTDATKLGWDTNAQQLAITKLEALND